MDGSGGSGSDLAGFGWIWSRFISGCRGDANQIQTISGTDQNIGKTDGDDNGADLKYICIWGRYIHRGVDSGEEDDPPAIVKAGNKLRSSRGFPRGS